MPETKSGIHYRVEGKGENVTLVHGVGASSKSWDRIAESLARDYTIIRLDLRGHGDSPRIDKPITLPSFADDVISVWDALGVERSHLVGFSLGGMIAQYLAVTVPERIDKLVILSAVANRTPDEQQKVLDRLAKIRAEGIKSVAEAAKNRWFTESFARNHPDAIEQRLRELVANDFGSYCEAYRVFAESNVGDRLEEIGHDTLVATGEDDVGSNTRMAEEMAERILHSRLEILPGMRHSVLVEMPERIAELIQEHLAGR